MHTAAACPCATPSGRFQGSLEAAQDINVCPQSGGRPQAAPAGVEADARRDGVEQAAHAGSSVQQHGPVKTTAGQQQPAAPASTSAEQHPAAGASETAHVSPQVNMARVMLPGPLVAVESQSSTKRGSTDFQWSKSSLADMPLMSGVQNSRMDSLALLQKVLHVGVSDAIVHAQVRHSNSPNTRAGFACWRTCVSMPPSTLYLIAISSSPCARICCQMVKVWIRACAAERIGRGLGAHVF